MFFDRSTAARAFSMAGLLTENMEEVEGGGGGAAAAIVEDSNRGGREVNEEPSCS
jgi:hypothetical protein